MFLLDTNVISELRRHDRANPRVLDWARAVDPAELFISAVTVLEIELGVLLAERRDPRQGAVLRNWFDNYLLSAFGGRVLPIDVRVARQTAYLHVPDPRPERDALIAATAIVQQMTLVTRDVIDFARMGVKVLSPWD